MWITRACRKLPDAAAKLPLLFIIAVFMSAVDGFHRPSLESLTPKLVNAEDLSAVSALASLRGTAAAIVGPALAGGVHRDSRSAVHLRYGRHELRDFPGRAVCNPVDAAGGWAKPAGFSSIMEGFAYAASRPELIGTYVVDIVALTFAMPMAVFPALAAQWGGAHAIGYLYSAMSVGGLIITVFSGWTRNVQRRGAAVVIAATACGVSSTGLGFARSLPVAIVCLAAAGAADMVSGLFRMTIWNETMPSHLRGRLAAIEQLLYMTGPLLGNARAGFMAERFGLARSIVMGGVVCVAGVIACVPLLPAFWRYRKASGP